MGNMDETLLKKVVDCHEKDDTKGVIALLKTDGKTTQSIELLTDTYYQLKEYEKMKPSFIEMLNIETYWNVEERY